MSLLAAQSNKSGKWSGLRECGIFFIVRFPWEKGFDKRPGAGCQTASGQRYFDSDFGWTAG
jgi:hypothetical protein